MTEIKTSGLMCGKPVNVGETWASSFDHEIQGLVVGFKSNNACVIEITKSNFETYKVGDLHTLANPHWVKIEPKVKLYIYYNTRYNKFVAKDTIIDQHDDSIKLLEVREYNREELQ